MDRIGVFARRPVPGGVKTRLSPALPPGLACALYRAMLEDALAAASAAPADARALWWAGPPVPGEPFPAPPGFDEATQQGDDLGERLVHAFGTLLPGDGDRALVLGADCPDLDAGMLGEAWRRLATHDLVIAPARDGGYTAIGLSRPAPEIFHGVEWSTARVLEQTLERARASALTVALLEPLVDLDTPDALVRWLPTAATAPPAHAARTRAALTAIGLLPTPG